MANTTFTSIHCNCPVSLIANWESTRGPFADTLCVLAIVSNLLTILVLRHIKKRSTTDNLLLVISAVDLTLPCIFLARHVCVVFNATGEFRYYLFYMWLVFSNISILLTLLLAVRRFIAIEHPYAYNSFCKTHTTRNLIFATFVLCIILFLPVCFYRPAPNLWTICNNRVLIQDILYTSIIISVEHSIGEIYFLRFAYWLLYVFGFQILCPLILVGLGVKIRIAAKKLCTTNQQSFDSKTRMILILSVIAAVRDLPLGLLAISHHVFTWQDLGCITSLRLVTKELAVLMAALNLVVLCVTNDKFRTAMSSWLRPRHFSELFSFPRQRTLFANRPLFFVCSATIRTETFDSENPPSPLPVRRSHVNITRVFADEKPFSFKRIRPLIRAQRRFHEQRDASTLASVYEVIDRDSVVVEANNDSNFLNDIPDSSAFNFKIPERPAKKQQEVACVSNVSDGVCLSKEKCHKRSGTIGNLCKQEKGSHCCTFIHTCGASSPERISYFRSPPNTSSKSQGSLACDYDVRIQKDTCAVRVEYTNVNLARKLGGVCDVDQIYILNSVDGPTNGQCGPLSGYATTVAVKPKQDKPLKIALLVQNDATYNWDIKLTQLSCNEIYEFKAPQPCGMTFKEPTPSESHFNPTYTRYSFSFQPASEVDGGKASNGIWWSYPEPIFNMYYYSSTKRHLLQESSDPSPSRYEHAERRIVGGTDAGVNEFPWQVAIAMDDLFFCGGALVNENYVLTAAHCVLTRDTPIGSLKLHLGDHNLMTPNETNHVAKGVRRIFFHSHFHSFLLDNDIALLQLDSPVTFADNIQPICLPDPNEMYTNKKATVGGWGITSYPMGTPSPMLQKIQVEVVSNFHCSRIVEETVGAGMLCAAPPALQGTCFGDSGGPLSIEADSGRHVLIGIVSYGLTGCALVPAFPDIYTRVSEYLKWIEVNAL